VVFFKQVASPSTNYFSIQLFLAMNSFSCTALLREKIEGLYLSTSAIAPQRNPRGGKRFSVCRDAHRVYGKGPFRIDAAGKAELFRRYGRLQIGSNRS
jgi:hypothetical protein